MRNLELRTLVKPYPNGLMQEYYDAWRSEPADTRVRVKDGGIYKAPEKWELLDLVSLNLDALINLLKVQLGEVQGLKAEYLQAGKSLGYTDGQVLGAYEREIQRQRSFMRHKSGGAHLDHMYPASRGGLEHSRNYRFYAADNLFKSAKAGAKNLYQKMKVPMTLLEAVRMDLEDVPKPTGRQQRTALRQAGLLRPNVTPQSGFVSTQAATTAGMGMLAGGVAPAVFDPAFPTDNPVTQAN